jgi:hypothetical protein
VAGLDWLRRGCDGVSCERFDAYFFRRNAISRSRRKDDRCAGGTISTARPTPRHEDTDEPDEAYADWPGEYLPVRLPWPLDSDTKRRASGQSVGSAA